jgi:hypothetical protein
VLILQQTVLVVEAEPAQSVYPAHAVVVQVQDGILLCSQHFLQPADLDARQSS